MLCSNCHSPITPVVALDLDGTLGDYHAHFLDFALDWTGIGPECDPFGYAGVESFSEYCCRVFDIDLTTFRDIKLAYRQGALKRTMPVYGGARELTSWLFQNGVEVWVTTTRPYLRLDGIDPDTREWLRRNGIGFDRLLYDEDKYRLLAERVDHWRVVAVLDDQADQLAAAARLFGSHNAIFRRTRWNRGVTWIGSEVDDLEGARLLIQSRLTREVT